MKVSRRLLTIPASPIRKLVPLATAAKKQGVKVYHLNIGDPDISSPQVMIDSLKDWKKPQVSYSDSQGDDEFLDAVLFYYHQLGYLFLKKKNIQVTLGGSEAIMMALFSVTEVGDEVLVFEPFYTNYQSFAAYHGLKLRAITTLITNGFHLPPSKEIESKITKKTKAILFCNPNNPTGTVLRKDEIETLVKLAIKYRLFLLSDEVYREFVFGGKKHISLFSFMKKIPDQAVVLDSLSKRYSLCGARLGMLVCLNESIMDGVLRIAQGRLSAGTLDQKVASKLTKVSASYFKKIAKEYEQRRNILFKGLRNIPGVQVFKPEGAFYLVVGLPLTDAERFCKWLLTDFRLNNETIMLAPAAGFYATAGLGKNEVRIAYVINSNDLKKSLKILKEGLKVYNSKPPTSPRLRGASKS